LKADEQCYTGHLDQVGQSSTKLGYVGYSSTYFEHGVKCSAKILDGGKSSTDILVVAHGYT